MTREGEKALSQSPLAARLGRRLLCNHEVVKLALLPLTRAAAAHA